MNAHVLRIVEDLVSATPFRSFTPYDWYGFAGAEPGSLICSGEKFVFILSPNGQLSAIDENGHETSFTPTEVC